MKSDIDTLVCELLKCTNDEEYNSFLNTVSVSQLAELQVAISELSAQHLIPDSADTSKYSVVFSVNNSMEFYKTAAYTGMVGYMYQCAGELSKKNPEKFSNVVEFLDTLFNREDKENTMTMFDHTVTRKGLTYFRSYCDLNYDNISDAVYTNTGLTELVPSSSSILIATTCDTPDEAESYIKKNIKKSMSTMTGFVVQHNRWAILSPYLNNRDAKIVDQEAAVIGSIMSERDKDSKLTQSLLNSRKLNNVDQAHIKERMDDVNELYKQSDEPLDLAEGEQELRVIDTVNDKSTYFAI